MNLNSYIDHTYLKPEGTQVEIDQLIKEAIDYQFKTVCINPTWIEYANAALRGTDVEVCTVIGFPLGAMSTESKIFEARDAIDKGADEVDMVINIGMLKNRDLDYVSSEIRSIKNTCQNKILKVIIETALLTEEEIALASQAVLQGGGDFVKTSTGFSTGGATLEDVALMRKAVGADLGVKASGGVANYAEAIAMIDAGATRIGHLKGLQSLRKNLQMLQATIITNYHQTII